MGGELREKFIIDEVRKEAKEQWKKELVEKLPKEKRYHLQWEGIDDLEERHRREKYNDEVSGYINQAIEDYKKIIENY